jgi:hypothetical protein
MAATLITVALIASLMMNREKDCCRLKAMRLAIKEATFNRHDFSGQKWSEGPHFCTNIA